MANQDFSWIADVGKTIGDGILKYPELKRADQAIEESRNIASDMAQDVTNLYQTLINDPDSQEKLKQAYGDNYDAILQKKFGKLDPSNLTKAKRGRHKGKSIEDKATYVSKANNLFASLANIGLDLPVLYQASLTGAMNPETTQEYRAQINNAQKKEAVQGFLEQEFVSENDMFTKMSELGIDGNQPEVAQFIDSKRNKIKGNIANQTYSNLDEANKAITDSGNSISDPTFKDMRESAAYNGVTSAIDGIVGVDEDGIVSSDSYLKSFIDGTSGNKNLDVIGLRADLFNKISPQNSLEKKELDKFIEAAEYMVKADNKAFLDAELVKVADKKASNAGSRAMKTKMQQATTALNALTKEAASINKVLGETEDKSTQIKLKARQKANDRRISNITEHIAKLDVNEVGPLDLGKIYDANDYGMQTDYAEAMAEVLKFNAADYGYKKGKYDSETLLNDVKDIITESYAGDRSAITIRHMSGNKYLVDIKGEPFLVFNDLPDERQVTGKPNSEGKTQEQTFLDINVTPATTYFNQLKAGKAPTVDENQSVEVTSLEDITPDMIGKEITNGGNKMVLTEELYNTFVKK